MLSAVGLACAEASRSCSSSWSRGSERVSVKGTPSLSVGSWISGEELPPPVSPAYVCCLGQTQGGPHPGTPHLS